MSDLNQFSTDVLRLDDSFQRREAHLLHFQNGRIVEKSGLQRFAAKLGFIWQWITCRIQKKQYEKYQTLFRKCRRGYQKDRALQNQEVIKSHSFSHLTFVDVQKIKKICNQFHFRIRNLERDFLQNQKDQIQDPFEEIQDLQTDSLEELIQNHFSSDEIQSELNRAYQVRKSIHDLQAAGELSEPETEGLEPILKITDLFHDYGMNLHQSFRAKFGAVPIADGEPVPSKRQLKNAFQMAHDDPILGQLLEERGQNSEGGLIIARMIQTILVGNEIDHVDYPKEFICFTYREAKQKNREILLVCKRKYHNYLDWYLRGDLKAGQTVDDKIEQSLQEFQRDVSRTKFVIGDQELDLLTEEEFDRIVTATFGPNENEYLGLDALDRMKCVAYQSLWAVSPRDFGSHELSVMKQMSQNHCMVTGTDTQMYIHGWNDIEAEAVYYGRDVDGNFALVCKMQENIHARIIGSRRCGVVKQKNFYVSPEYLAHF